MRPPSNERRSRVFGRWRVFYTDTPPCSIVGTLDLTRFRWQVDEGLGRGDGPRLNFCNVPSTYDREREREREREGLPSLKHTRYHQKTFALFIKRISSKATFESRVPRRQTRQNISKPIACPRQTPPACAPCPDTWALLRIRYPFFSSWILLVRATRARDAGRFFTSCRP